MVKSIVWLKRDLRNVDQPLLKEWKQDPSLNELIHFKFENDDRIASQSKLSFQQQRLDSFSHSIQGKLKTIQTSHELFFSTFHELIDSIKPQKIITSREYAYSDWKRNDAIRTLCKKKGIHFEELNTFCLHDSIDPTTLPHVFTDFRKLIENKPVAFSDLDPIQLEEQTDAGLKRLHYFLFQSKRIQTYKITRNGMIDPDDSSHFSPFLAVGALAVKRIWFEIERFEKEYGSNDSTYWLTFELLWREFFIWNALKHQNLLFAAGGIKNQVLSHDHQDTHFDAWKNGRTADEFVNANMNELRLTGWMSNRGRQNVASYLVHDLNLDWQKGAEWFEQQLIDYEPCANWGNWNYIAGVGNDPRPFRKFNLVKQREQYDPTGEYVQRWGRKFN